MPTTATRTETQVMRALNTRIRRVARGTLGGWQTISMGGLRLISTAALIVEDGASILVNGLVKISGHLQASGTNDLDGTNNLTGTNNLSGPTNVTGNLTQTAGTATFDSDVEINGDTLLKGDLTAQDGGKVEIKEGGEFRVDANNPLVLSADNANALQWEQGAYLASNDGGVGIGASGHSAVLQANANGTASIFYADGHTALGTNTSGAVQLTNDSGTASIALSSTGIVFAGWLTPSSAHTPNVWINPANGLLYLIPPS